MSGKHFNVHEVGCCIKYFIFGFNIIFWVSLTVIVIIIYLLDCFFKKVSHFFDIHKILFFNIFFIFRIFNVYKS